MFCNASLWDQHLPQEMCGKNKAFCLLFPHTNSKSKFNSIYLKFECFVDTVKLNFSASNGSNVGIACTMKGIVECNGDCNGNQVSYITIY